MRDWLGAPARAALALALLMAFPVAAQAGGLHLQPGLFSDPQFNPTITFGADISHISGAAHEYVYQNAGTYKLSELDWQINNVTMLNANIGFRPSPCLAFDLSAGTKLTGSSHMDDYDWVWFGPDNWDHWSDSPDTSIKTANRVDFTTTLSLYRHPAFTVDALAGLRWSDWEFEASGGTFIYSSDPSNFRDQTGTIPGGPGITYKQELFAPYLGLGLNANVGKLGINASLVGSDWVTANGYDQHHLRFDISPTGGLFHDSMHNGAFYDIKLGGSYKYSEQISFKIGWEREDYLLVKGSEAISAIGTGVNGSGGGPAFVFQGPASGLDNLTDRYTAGTTYKMP